MLRIVEALSCINCCLIISTFHVPDCGWISELIVASSGRPIGGIVMLKVEGRWRHLSVCILMEESSPTCHLLPCLTIRYAANILFHTYEGLLLSSAWCRTDNTCLLGAVGAPEVITQNQKGVPVGAIKATMLELHEICKLKGNNILIQTHDNISVT